MDQTLVTKTSIESMSITLKLSRTFQLEQSQVLKQELCTIEVAQISFGPSSWVSHSLECSDSPLMHQLQDSQQNLLHHMMLLDTCVDMKTKNSNHSQRCISHIWILMLKMMKTNNLTYQKLHTVEFVLNHAQMQRISRVKNGGLTIVKMLCVMKLQVNLVKHKCALKLKLIQLLLHLTHQELYSHTVFLYQIKMELKQFTTNSRKISWNLKLVQFFKTLLILGKQTFALSSLDLLLRCCSCIS